MRFLLAVAVYDSILELLLLRASCNPNEDDLHLGLLSQNLVKAGKRRGGEARKVNQFTKIGKSTLKAGG